MPRSIVRVAEPEELGALPKNVHDWTSGFIEVLGTKSVLSSSAFDPLVVSSLRTEDQLSAAWPSQIFPGRTGRS